MITRQSWAMGDTASSKKTANELVYTITIWYEFYHTSNKDEATIGKFHPDDLQLVYLVLKSTLQGWIIKYFSYESYAKLSTTNITNRLFYKILSLIKLFGKLLRHIIFRIILGSLLSLTFDKESVVCKPSKSLVLILHLNCHFLSLLFF